MQFRNIYFCSVTPILCFTEVPEVGPVAATPVSSEAIDVTWIVTYDGNLPFTCIVEYRVDQSGIWMESTPRPSQQSESHQVTGLEAFTLYSIQVTCRNRVGNGIPSILVTSVTTKQAGKNTHSIIIFKAKLIL